MSMQTEEELNSQVQSLVKKGSFTTAAEVIADWAYWDMIGRFEEEADVPLPVLEGKRVTDDRKAGGSMKGQLEDRMNEEFGEDGWKA